MQPVIDYRRSTSTLRAGYESRSNNTARTNLLELKPLPAPSFAVDTSHIQMPQGHRTSPPTSSSLSPSDKHYLNRILVNLEVHREWVNVGKLGDLATYGSPYARDRPGHIVEPSVILPYLHYRYLLYFPGMERASESYWKDRIQDFFDSIAARGLSDTALRNAITKRRLLGMGLAQVLGTYVQTTLPPAGTAYPARPTKSLMRSLDSLFPGSMDAMWASVVGGPVKYNAFVAVLEGHARGTSDYFILSRVLAVEKRPEFYVQRSIEELETFLATLEGIDSAQSLDLPSPPPLDPQPSRYVVQTYLRLVTIALSASRAGTTAVLKQARAVLETFLLDRPLEADMEQLFAQVEAEDRVLDSRHAAWVAQGVRVKTLRSAYATFKRDLIHADGLNVSWALLRRTPTAAELPVEYAHCEEFARIWVAYAFHAIFVSSPGGRDRALALKSILRFIPFAAMQLGLKLVNPTLALRIFFSIILFAPPGGLSLVQRIFRLVLGPGVKEKKSRVGALVKDLADGEVSAAVRRYVYVGPAEREARKANSVRGESSIDAVLRTQCTSTAAERVQSWSRLDPARYRLLEDLFQTTVLLRDREQVLELGEEATVPKLLKATLEIYYPTIYGIANACRLDKRLADLQAFLYDLVDVSLSGRNDASSFISLVARHHESLWLFLHEMARYGTLMDPLKEWCRGGLRMIREGVPDVEGTGRATVDLDALIETVDLETQGEIMTEVRGLALYSKYQKAFSDISLRVDLINASSTTETPFDKAALYRTLLAQDPAVLEYLDSRVEPLNDAPEDDVGWAYFADSSEMRRVDWRTAAAVEAELVAARKRKGKKSKQPVRVLNHQRSEAAPLPAPRVHACRALLREYTEIVGRSLRAARDSGVR